MQSRLWKKALYLGFAAIAAWLGVRYVLPVSLPFLLGALVALAAEPVVRFGMNRCHLPRGAATGIGVALTLVMTAALVSLGAAALVRELGHLAGTIPNLEEGAEVLEDWLISVADKTPEGVRPMAQRTVLELFDGGSAVFQQVTDRIPGAVSGIVSGVGSSLLGIGTGIVSSFLISARLPQIREFITSHLPQSWFETWLPALRRCKGGLFGWAKAQGKLFLLVWGIVGLGLTLLRIPYGLFWAALIAMVDAVPMLGTGLVLGPWAAVRFLRGDTVQGIGLLCVYGGAALTRTVLEPRLVGRQLGLDPLVTLLALYVGFRIWGVAGLLLAPVLATAIKSLFPNKKPLSDI